MISNFEAGKACTGIVVCEYSDGVYPLK